MSGDIIFNCIWMAQTAPMKMLITITRGIESKPSLETSAIVRRAITPQRSGRAKTRFINIQYWPKVAKESVIIIVFN